MRHSISGSANKPLVWLAGEIKTPPFSRGARIDAGVLLRQLQQGDKLKMPAYRPMPSIGARCGELRVADGVANWRVMLRIDSDAIVILEVFAKKTKTTPKKVIARCKRRLKAYEQVEHK